LLSRNQFLDDSSIRFSLDNLFASVPVDVITFGGKDKRIALPLAKRYLQHTAGLFAGILGQECKWCNECGPVPVKRVIGVPKKYVRLQLTDLALKERMLQHLAYYNTGRPQFADALEPVFITHNRTPFITVKYTNRQSYGRNNYKDIHPVKILYEKSSAFYRAVAFSPAWQMAAACFPDLYNTQQ
jgi:hypothetical protein